MSEAAPEADPNTDAAESDLLRALVADMVDYLVRVSASIYASTADFARCPPSTTSELPVRNAASSESRKATA